ncbi:MAG: ATP-binding cassette domain-containing protein [Salinisphaera sp.]|nr:ATP-binding cassette domain-containing protein [Salinisphaera sp.]
MAGGIIVTVTATETNGLMPLQVNGLGLSRDGRALLRDIDFCLQAGRITAVLGPNGAGKTLLLRLLCGLIAPDAGRIDWHGLDPRAAMPRLGLVLQRPVMLRRSARANIEFALARRGLPRAERRTRAETALDWAGLSGLARQPAPRLSGGEAQRLAIVRAWAQQPEVLCLDEPCANLDPSSSQAVETLIHRIHAAGTRVIFTGHDMGQTRRLADDVLFLASGRLCEHTPAAVFFERPATPEAAAYLEGRLLT